VIDLREFGETDDKYIEGFLRYFRDVYLYASVFAYCKNPAYCHYKTTSSVYIVPFTIYHASTGRCYDPNDFWKYFYWGFLGEILAGKSTTEAEVEQKIIDYYLNHLGIVLNKPLDVTIYKIYEKVRVLWIVMLPVDVCFK
jgi:hypothetical protein